MTADVDSVWTLLASALAALEDLNSGVLSLFPSQVEGSCLSAPSPVSTN